MSKRKTIIGIVLFLSLLFTGQAFADRQRTEIAYWGASGTAYCHNYENVSIWVGMSYMHQNDALTALWNSAVAACRYRGGVYDVSGSAYCQWGPYW